MTPEDRQLLADISRDVTATARLVSEVLGMSLALGDPDPEQAARWRELGAGLQQLGTRCVSRGQELDYIDAPTPFAVTGDPREPKHHQ